MNFSSNCILTGGLALWATIICVVCVTKVVGNDQIKPSACRLSSGEDGFCRLISECPPVLQTFRVVVPILCGWANKVPIVCCPRSSDLASTDVCAPVIPSSPSSRTVRQASLLPFALKPPTMTTADLKETANSLNKPLIVGGVDVSLDTRPWMAAIADKGLEDPLSRSFCGASLIGDRYVLTAAHCFEGRALDPTKYEVLVGSNNLSSSMGFDVEKFIIHPGFRQPKWYNDIALVKLREEVPFGPSVRAICLPPPHLRAVKFQSSEGTVAGWGTVEFGGDMSAKLQEVTLPMIPSDKCNTTFLSLRGTIRRYPDGITDSLLCAGHDTKAQDACSGDSGGPLFWPDPASRRWIIIGVVSSGYQCAIPGIPGIYTRVTAFLDWILLNIK